MFGATMDIIYISFPLLAGNFVTTGLDGNSTCPYLCKMPHPKYGMQYSISMLFDLPFIMCSSLLAGLV